MYISGSKSTSVIGSAMQLALLNSFGNVYSLLMTSNDLIRLDKLQLDFHKESITCTSKHGNVWKFLLPYGLKFSVTIFRLTRLEVKLKLIRKETWLKSDGREIKYCIDGKFIVHHMDLANLFRGASCCQNMGAKPPSYVLTGMLRLQSKLELTAVSDDKLQTWPKEMVLLNENIIFPFGTPTVEPFNILKCETMKKLRSNSVGRRFSTRY